MRSIWRKATTLRMPMLRLLVRVRVSMRRKRAWKGRGPRRVLAATPRQNTRIVVLPTGGESATKY